GHAGGGRRDQVINTVGAGDFLFQRRGNKALDQIRVSTDINGSYRNNRVLQFRILAHVEVARRTNTEQQDKQADHGGQHRFIDKDVSKFHALPQLLAGVGAASSAGFTSFSSNTGASLRSFSKPEVATFSPGSRPSITATRSPRVGPSLMKRFFTVSFGLPSSSFSPVSLMTNTALP